ncbi:MAG: hypothetical protein RL701_461 [Pseudomonadota bacterium]
MKTLPAYVLWLLLASSAHTSAQNPPPSAAASHAPDPARFSVAVGLSIAEELRGDYSASTRAAFAPELLALGYIPLPLRDVYLRAGMRIGYDGLDQADMPRQVRLTERGLHELVELGILYDWVVVPALSIGGGLAQRFIDLETRGGVKGTQRLDHTEVLGQIYVALGLGIPIAHGLVVIEPFFRVQHVFDDPRAVLRLGLDVTLRL